MRYITPFNQAPIHKRFIGLYYYSNYWKKWDKILGTRDGWEWKVQEVDLNGKAIGDIRHHCTAMNAGHFANTPFNVKSSDL